MELTSPRSRAAVAAGLLAALALAGCRPGGPGGPQAARAAADAPPSAPAADSPPTAAETAAGNGAGEAVPVGDAGGVGEAAPGHDTPDSSGTRGADPPTAAAPATSSTTAVPPVERRTAVVDHHLVPCYGVGPRMCMSVDEGSGFRFFYGSIEGFTYSWGTRSVLEVEVRQVQDPPADAPSHRYFLREVRSSQPVAAGTSFRVAIWEAHLAALDAEGGTLLGGKRFTCADPSVCRALHDATRSGNRAMATFTHPAGPSEPLRLEEAAAAG